MKHGCFFDEITKILWHFHVAAYSGYMQKIMNDALVLAINFKLLPCSKSMHSLSGKIKIVHPSVDLIWDLICRLHQTDFLNFKIVTFIYVRGSPSYKQGPRNFSHSCFRDKHGNFLLRLQRIITAMVWRLVTLKHELRGPCQSTGSWLPKRNSGWCILQGLLQADTWIVK